MPGRSYRSNVVHALALALAPLTSGVVLADGLNVLTEPDFSDAYIDAVQPPHGPRFTPLYLVGDAPGYPGWARAHTDLPDEPEHTDLPDEPEAVFKGFKEVRVDARDTLGPFGDNPPPEAWLTLPFLPTNAPDYDDDPNAGGGSPIPAPGFIALALVAGAAGMSRRRR